jgi:hypothetical protein
MRKKTKRKRNITVSLASFCGIAEGLVLLFTICGEAVSFNSSIFAVLTESLILIIAGLIFSGSCKGNKVYQKNLVKAVNWKRKKRQLLRLCRNAKRIDKQWPAVSTSGT